jgi:UDP-2,3-diacylglucosamine hydrolase
MTRQFAQFLEHTAIHADALYILGDLFEYWAGDDDLTDPHHQQVIQALSGFSKRGISCYLIHGNRDFLIGNGFAKAAELQILPDPAALELYGHRLLVSHGDALCTDDAAYQAFRLQVRQPEWQQHFLNQPLATRKTQIEALRIRSEKEKNIKSNSIMDVNELAVAELLKAHDYPEIFIHGHTHRPALHQINIDGHVIERWVLGDWYDQGSCLKLSKAGCRVLLPGKTADVCWQ